MKVLFTADLHDDRELIEKVIKESKDSNLVVIAGDVLSYFGTLSYPLFSKIEKPIIFVPGNHDSPEFIDFVYNEYSNVYIVHLSKKKIGDLTFAGIGFSVLIGPWTEEEGKIERFLNKLKREKDIVLITHENPTKTSEIIGIEGNKLLDKFLENYKVLIHAHGHIHELGCLEMKIGSNRVINVARCIKKIDI